MINVRYNTNYGKLPDQKRWRVLIEGSQVFTDKVEISTKSWTTTDVIDGVIKQHVTCNPEIISKNEDEIQLKDYYDLEENEIVDLICFKWSMSENKWKVCIKGEDRLYENIVLNTKVWTSDISPEMCCRPKHIGVTEIDSKKTIYLSDNL